VYLSILSEIGVALGGKSSSIRDYVRAEYGAFEVPEAPATLDLEIEFVDDVSSPEDCVLVRAPISYDDDGVFLHDPQYRVFRIDWASAQSGTWRARCDVGFNPHFFAIIMEWITHFQFLKREAVFCHSSAFRLNGKGVLCPAWRNVGKTNLLLSFLQAGAEYIADDWSIVQRDGTFRCLPKRLNLLYYNFAAFPELLAEVPDDFAALLRFVERAKAGEYDLNQSAMEVLEGQARMRISPYDLFDQQMDTAARPIDHVLLLQRAHGTETPVTVEPIDHAALVASLSSILHFEQSHFHLAYDVFRARTGQRVDLLETARSAGERVIEQAVAGIAQPYRVVLPSQRGAREAFDRICELLQEEDGRAAARRHTGKAGFASAAE